jgi:exosortase
MPILLAGLLIFGYGIWPGQNDFVKDFGMVVTLFGLTLLLTGWEVMKIAWFPIVFLVCAIPWPGLVYSWVAGPLQQLAATVAVNVLELTGVKSFAGGTKIFIYGHDNALRTLNVAEACAGLRSLMTFISVAAAVAFLSARPLWQKLIICVSAVPIAISCNVMRVAGQGLLDHYVSQQLSENFAHQFVGLIMLIPAFLLILAVGWVLDQMFVEESERHHSVEPVVLRRAQAAPAALAVPPPPPLVAVRPPPVPRPAGRTFSPRGLPPRIVPPTLPPGKSNGGPT